MSISRRPDTRYLAPLLSLAVITGCAQLPLWPQKKTELPAATEQEPAVDIVCIWQPAYGKGRNGLPTRGVAGQLMFFTARNPTPVVVDGNLRVYLFDDHGTMAERSKPSHIFDVPAGQWPAHFRQSSLGPAYEIFVPYVRGGNEQVTCSLQVRFTPLTGPPVYSRMASVTLPGTAPAQDAESDNASVSQAGYTGNTDPAPSSRQPGIAVRTIHTRDLVSASGERRDNQPAAEPAARQVDGLAASGSGVARQREEDLSPALAQRLERLEQLVLQLAEQRHEPSRPAPPAAVPLNYPTSRHPHAAADRSHGHPPTGGEDEPRRRFRLTPAANPLVAAAPHSPGASQSVRPDHPLAR